MSGDPGWVNAWSGLLALHRQKSATYGTAADPLANFVQVAEFEQQDPEVYVIDRVVEKLTRARNMIRAGDGAAVVEYPDCASLMLCAEALRRRRL